MHGVQRALACTVKFPDEKLSGNYPINANLRLLIDDIIAGSRRFPIPWTDVQRRSQ
jgi:hypothetical protein